MGLLLAIMRAAASNTNGSTSGRLSRVLVTPPTLSTAGRPPPSPSSEAAVLASDVLEEREGRRLLARGLGRVAVSPGSRGVSPTA